MKRSLDDVVVFEFVENFRHNAGDITARELVASFRPAKQRLDAAIKNARPLLDDPWENADMIEFIICTMSRAADEIESYTIGELENG